PNPNPNVGPFDGRTPRTLVVGTTINGVFQGWQTVGSADEPLVSDSVSPSWHTYQIRLHAGGTFSVLRDGTRLQSGISARAASAWTGGIGSGSLFNQSPVSDGHLSTFFDNVRAFGTPLVAPAITTQPASRIVNAGQSATFSVAATGTAPLTYQWQKLVNA